MNQYKQETTMMKETMDEFNQAYNGAREIIHEIYVRRLGKDPITGGEKISPALAKQES